jgi:hypothetical protein
MMYAPVVLIIFYQTINYHNNDENTNLVLCEITGNLHILIKVFQQFLSFKKAPSLNNRRSRIQYESQTLNAVSLKQISSAFLI